MHMQADTWAELHAAAWEIEETRVQEGLEYADLSAIEVKTLVSYVFRAHKAKGASEHTGKKAAAVAFMEALAPGELEHLLMRTEPGVATAVIVGPAAALTQEPEARQLTFTGP